MMSVCTVLAATTLFATAFTALQPAALRDVRMTGWIGDKAGRLFEERVLGDWAQNVMMKECEDAFVEKRDDESPVGLWRGEFWGKTMLGFVGVAEYTQSRRLLDFIRASAKRVIATADETGYIGSYRNKHFVRIGPEDLPRVKRELGWECDWNWNVWCQTFTIWGLAEVGRVTGDPEIVRGASRALAQLIDMLHADQVDITQTGCNAGLPSCTLIRPAVLLYRMTKDERFKAFADDVRARWDRDGALPPNFFRNVGKGVTPYRWYADVFDHERNYEWPKVNEMTSCLEGLVEFAQATGDARSFETARRIFDVLWRDERNAVGSVGYNDRFHDAATIPSAVTEPCDVIVWMMFCRDLYLATGESKYLDVLEETYLNAFLAGQTRDGTGGMRCVRSHARHTFAKPHSGMKHSHCCVNNLPRGYMAAAETILARDESGAYRIGHYIDSRARMDGVSVEVSGNWPVSDVARVKVESERPVELRFRIPSWTTKAKVDGREVLSDGGWYACSVGKGVRTFEMAFDMSPRLVPAVKQVDVENAACRHIVGTRWYAYSDDNADLVPYVLLREFPRLKRGPLYLAKGTALGTTLSDVFFWGRAGVGSHDCTLEPIANEGVWGAWKAKFVPKPGTEAKAFEVNVSDFQSVADRKESAPVKSFSIYF